MSCCSEPKSKNKNGGGCCGGSRPFPWFSAVCDSTIRRLFFQRYWRELLLGLATGGLTSLAALPLGEAMGGLGPLLGGSWFHLHVGALLPTALLSGLILALAGAGAGQGPRLGLATAGWVLGLALLGGCGNGLLETNPASLAAFLAEGGLVSALLFGLLILPASWLVWAALGTLIPAREPKQSCP